MKQRPTRWYRPLLAGLLALFLAACGGGGGEFLSTGGGGTVDTGGGGGGGGGGGNVTPPPVVPVVRDGEAIIPDSGGSVKIQDSASPIFGTEVIIPANAMPGATETITITYQDQLPGPLTPEALALGARQLGKVVVLTRTGNVDFGQAITVRVPFDKNSLAPDAIPIVVVWDEALQAYAPVTLRSLDRVNGVATFVTSHFSKYALLVLDALFGTPGPDPQALAFDVGFVPATDGFFDHNFGSYDAPGGNCFGMAGYSAWYHKWMKPTRNAGLSSLYREGDPVFEEDDQIERELISRAFQLGEQKAHIAALDWVNDQHFLTRALADRFTAYSILAQLYVTKQAQILAMGVSGATGWTNGHAVNVYAYDGTKKVFLLYDNNFPGEVVELAWDPTNGFGTYSKGVTWDRFAFASFSQAYSPATLRTLFDGAEAGWPASKFPKITITSPTESTTTSGLYEVQSEDNVVIAGTVPRPATADNPNAQRYVHVYLNGIKAGAGIPVGNADDAFSINIAKLPTAAGTDVMLLVSESAKSWASAFAAFKHFKVRVKGQFFFRNFGFETGDFTFWASERHVWGGGSQVIPSDKSAVVAFGPMDPIATDLPVALFGRQSARVNNEDNNLHISTLTQSAVVPSVANPVVRFYWAAVLEDPQHDAADQPYVEVTVTNETKSTVLYHRKFYSNDPSYSGWKSYQGGNWKSIPWQLVELPVATSAGDTLQLKVEAADCALSGHGGYAYLDAEE